MLQAAVNARNWDLAVALRGERILQHGKALSEVRQRSMSIAVGSSRSGARLGVS